MRSYFGCAARPQTSRPSSVAGMSIQGWAQAGIACTIQSTVRTFRGNIPRRTNAYSCECVSHCSAQRGKGDASDDISGADLIWYLSFPQPATLHGSNRCCPLLQYICFWHLTSVLRRGMTTPVRTSANADANVKGAPGLIGADPGTYKTL